MLLLTVWAGSAARAQTRINVGGRAASTNQPAKNQSFVAGSTVTDSSGQWQYIVAFGTTPGTNSKLYADFLANWSGSTVDVVMSQCHGGGFLTNVAANSSQPNWTFASASPWGTPARSEFRVGPSLGYVDNFSRAWREDALLYTNAGMLEHFQTAVNGRPAGGGFAAIAPDPFSTNNARTTEFLYWGKLKLPLVTGTYRGKPGTWAYVGDSGPQATFASISSTTNPRGQPAWNVAYPNFANIPFTRQRQNGFVEYSQYASSSAASDGRTLSAGTNFSQFALLVVWGDPSLRHAVNVTRFYQTLTNAYGVPTSNIAVLFSNGMSFVGTRTLGPFTIAPGPNGAASENLPALRISGPSTAAAFSNALAGTYFSNQPGTNDHLLIYNTGHGGLRAYDGIQVGYSDNFWWVKMPRNRNDPRYGFSPDAVFDDQISALLAEGLDLTNYTESMVTLQLSSPFPITAPEVLVNGASLQSLQSPLVLVSDPINGVDALTNTIFDLDQVAPGGNTGNYTYQTVVPATLLLTNAQDFEIDLLGMPTTSLPSPNPFAAVVADGDDQEIIYTPPDLTQVGELTISPYGDHLLLAWPLGQTGYNLQENTDLTTTNWLTIAVAGTPNNTDPNFVIGTNWAVLNPSAQEFFRLVAP